MKTILCLLISGALWAQAPGAAADPVVLTVGSIKVTRSQFAALFKNLPESIRAEAGGDAPEAKRRIAEQFSEVIAYSNEARKLKLDSGPLYDFQEKSLLAGLLYQHLLSANMPSQAAVEAWFDAHQADYEQTKARQILIRFKGSKVPTRSGREDLSEEAALASVKALRERIAKGEDFAVLARTESDDPASSAKGGDLGTFTRGHLLPELDQAAFSLAPGAISQPVKTQFGWHLIQVENHKKQALPEVQAQIAQRLQTENAQKAMQALKSGITKTLDESYFGTSVAEPGPYAK